MSIRSLSYGIYPHYKENGYITSLTMSCRKQRGASSESIFNLICPSPRQLTIISKKGYVGERTWETIQFHINGVFSWCFSFACHFLNSSNRCLKLSWWFVFVVFTLYIIRRFLNNKTGNEYSLHKVGSVA